MTAKLYLTLVNTSALKPLLAVASMSSFINSGAGIIALISAVATAVCLIIAGVAMYQERSSATAKWALIGAMLSGGAFTISIAMFLAGGVTVNINPTAPS